MKTENNNWYDSFIEALNKIYPKKSQLIQALMDLLIIEREAVYRRLRKDVIFTFHEIVKIASAWNISLDEITSINTGTYTFQMRKLNYINPNEDDLSVIRRVIQGLHFIKDYPSTEFLDICNKLPRQLLGGYKYLNQFYLFKWQYQYNNEEERIPFSQAIISEEKAKITEEYNLAIKTVPNSNFIWDSKLFDNLVSDIQYFYSIRMITDSEKDLIKQDLYDLLDYMHEVANKGCYPETQNKVNLYISQLNIDTNYSYTFSVAANICFVHVFEKFELFMINSELTNNFKTWMQSKKKTSIQISEVDERNRVEYFTKQRRLIDGL
jgi:hypothetical protein